MYVKYVLYNHNKPEIRVDLLSACACVMSSVCRPYQHLLHSSVELDGAVAVHQLAGVNEPGQLTGHY